MGKKRFVSDMKYNIYFVHLLLTAMVVVGLMVAQKNNRFSQKPRDELFNFMTSISVAEGFS